MASKVYWEEKPWIMSADYSGRVSVEDLESVSRICLDELRTQPLYFIVDISGVTAAPLNVTKIPLLLELVRHRHAQAFAWVGATRFARVMMPTFVFKPDRFCDTRDEALAYLRERIQNDQDTLGVFSAEQ